MIYLKDVDKIYTKYKGIFFRKESSCEQALKKINLSIKQAEHVAIIGENGSGKSTLIKVICGLIQPSAGYCLVNGMDPFNNRSKVNKYIGVVFGHKSLLWPNLSVEDNIEFIKRLYNIRDISFINYLIDTLELRPHFKKNLYALSLGFKMRCDLLAAFSFRPKILLLDEPTIGLDILIKAALHNLIQKLIEETQSTLVFTSHDLRELKKICERVVMLKEGQVIFDGNFTGLFNQFDWLRIIRTYVPLDNITFLEKIKTGDLITYIIDTRINSIKYIQEQCDVEIETPSIEDIVGYAYKEQI